MELSKAQSVKEGWVRVNDGSPTLWRLARRRFERSLRRPSRRLIWDSIPLTVNSRVLEEGAGGASLGLAVSLKTRAWVYAIDLAQEALRACQANAEDLRCRYGSLPFNPVRGDAFVLPFRDSVFDLIMSEGLMEHFADGKSRLIILREARRCLRPNGFLLLLIPNNEHPLTRWWQRRGYPWLDETSAVREYLIGPNQLACDLESSGFEVVCKDCENPWSTLAKYPNWGVLRALAYVLNRCVPLPHTLRLRLGIDAYVLGRKLSESAQP